MPDHLAPMHDIIARYLDGLTPFEEAVTELVTFLGSTGLGTPAPTSTEGGPRNIQLQTLTPEQWMNPPEPSAPHVVLSSMRLAPGRSPREEARARKVWFAAMKRLMKSKK